MNNNEKVFCGNAKLFTYKGDQTGMEIKVTLAELRAMVKVAEERGWVREFPARGETQREITLKAWPKKEPTKHSTHYIELTEPYRKSEGTQTTETGYSIAASIDADDDDGLPF